jgi:hypothetical protein
MTNHITLRQQLEAFERGQILSSGGEIDGAGCFNFYDWFCKSTSLEGKAKRLFSNVRTFLKHERSIDLDRHYVFFKNNCPMRGGLYDDFRICDIESGDVIWNVTPRSGHSGKAEVYWRERGFQDPYKEADTFGKLFKR